MPAVPPRRLPGAGELPVGGRPYEGKQIVRQKVLAPLPADIEPEIQRLVDEALTFDPSQPEPLLTVRLQEITDYLLEKQQFEALDAIADTLRTKQLVGPSGTWILGDLYKSINKQASIRNLQVWNRDHPPSLAAKHTLGCAYVDLAWDARGDGVASTVTEGGWQTFSQHLEKAQLLLDSSAKSGDPYSYTELITVGMGMGQEKEQVRTYLEGCREIAPYQVPEAYLAFARYLLPRWHGSEAEFNGFLKEAVEMTKSGLGSGMYGLLHQEFGSETGISKEQRLKAYEDLTDRFPYSLAYFEEYATITKHVSGSEKARELYQQLIDGKRPIPMTEGDRLRLQHKIDLEFGVSEKRAPLPKTSRTVLVHGLPYGTSRAKVLEKLGEPKKIGGSNPNKSIQFEFKDSKIEDNRVQFTFNPDTLQVIGIATKEIEVDGQSVAEGILYQDLVSLLGPPTGIFTGNNNVYVSFAQYHLVAYFHPGSDSAYWFTFHEEVRKYLGSSTTPLTLEEWKQTWK